MSNDPLSRYERLKIAGTGSYGTVYVCLDKETGILVALKRVKIDNVDEGIPSTSIREISILKTLNHPNIIELYTVIHSENKLSLVFEYMNGGDLEKFVRKYAHQQQQIYENNLKANAALAPPCLGLPPKLTRPFMKQLLYGLSFAANKKVLHRDLKSANILLNSEGVLKIADFGLARITSAPPVRAFSSCVTSLWYRAPELLLASRTYSSAIDVWSAGIIFGEMLLGRVPIKAQNELDAWTQICKIFGTPSESTWPGCTQLKNWDTFNQQLDGRIYKPCNLEKMFPHATPAAIDLFRKLCMLDPMQRINARDALKHEYFEGAHGTTDERDTGSGNNGTNGNISEDSSDSGAMSNSKHMILN